MIRPAVHVFAFAGLALAVSGCLSRPMPDAVKDPRTPTEQFALKVTSSPEEMRLAVHAQGLSSNQASALESFVAEWREGGGGAVRVQAPGGEGAATGPAYRTAEGARTRLIELGVPGEAVEVVGYDAAGAAGAPVLVSFQRQEVDIPQCGQRWTNIAHSATNKVQGNFGCAVTANMGAQIANPADLAAPRTMDPADAARREVTLEKYRKGEVTSAAPNPQAGGEISNAVR